MWSTKQRRFWNNTCSKIAAGILLFITMLALTACQTTKGTKEKAQQAKEADHWKPQEISKAEKAEAKKEVKEISKSCQNIKIDKNKVTSKELEQIYSALTKRGQEDHSKKNSPVQFKPSKTSHADKIKAFYKETKGGKTTTITLLQQNSSGGFARIKLESSKGKTTGILTTIYREEDGTLSISEMVKYKVKKLELNDKNILTLEFYLSDQAELQSDGTMEFQL